MSLLSHDELLTLINKKPPLVEPMIDTKIQVQPNGIELTLQRVETHESSGAVAFDNSERKLPQTRTVEFDSEGWVHLPKGSYKIVFNETVNIPKNIAAIASHFCEHQALYAGYPHDPVGWHFENCGDAVLFYHLCCEFVHGEALVFGAVAFVE